MTEVNEDLDALPAFNEPDWITVGKRYAGDLPLQVHYAKRDLLALPVSQLVHFPAPELPVCKFLQVKLPIQSSEIIITKPEHYFSKALPDTPVECLLQRSIPSKEFIQKLEAVLGQAWFDGAKSIVDHRFNNGTERLPMNALTFWKAMAETREKQAMWERSIHWLDVEEARCKDEETMEGIRMAKQGLTSIPWNAPLIYQNGMTGTLQLAILLSSAWLSDDHINMMMECLSEQVSADADLCSEVIIAPLWFSHALEKAAQNGSYSKKAVPLLALYEARVKEGIKRIYYPVNVNNNHWIAACIDFEHEVIGYGQSKSPS